MAYRHAEEIVVHIWGHEVGYLYPDARFAGRYLFEYNPAWVARGVNLSPLALRHVGADPQGPPAHSTDDDRATWHGMPALVADSVPDAFGNRVIDSALARNGVTPSDVTALDRLAYVGSRGMGALTFEPSHETEHQATPIDMRDLVEEARTVIQGNLHSSSRTDSLRDIIMTGTSAGGARPKAVIAWNRASNEVRPGNMPTPAGAGPFEQWLVKFDGIHKGDYDLKDPLGYTNSEYVYSLMARNAGIEMSETMLMSEGSREHFLTRRFDRPGTDGTRLHMQTLNAMAQMNFKYEGVHSYEAMVAHMKDFGLADYDTLEQVFRRAVFNVLASNNDDHTKNHAFLMKPDGAWSLAPAYDMSYAYKEGHRYIGQHFMSVNGKFSGITLDDLREFAIKDAWTVPAVEDNIRRVADAVADFPGLAREWDVPAALTREISERIDMLFRQAGVLRQPPSGRGFATRRDRAFRQCPHIVKATGKRCLKEAGHPVSATGAGHDSVRGPALG